MFCLQGLYKSCLFYLPWATTSHLSLLWEVIVSGRFRCTHLYLVIPGGQAESPPGESVKEPNDLCFTDELSTDEGLEANIQPLCYCEHIPEFNFSVHTIPEVEVNWHHFSVNIIL